MSAEKERYEVEHPAQHLVIPNTLYLVMDTHLWATIEAVVKKGGGSIKFDGMGDGFVPAFWKLEEAKRYAEVVGGREILTVAREVPMEGLGPPDPPSLPGMRVG